MWTQAARGLDRLGYNLICIADRVISIRVTAQSSFTRWREECVPEMSRSHIPTGRSFAIIYRQGLPARGASASLSGTQLSRRFYGRLQNGRCGRCYQAKAYRTLSFFRSHNKYVHVGRNFYSRALRYVTLRWDAQVPLHLRKKKKKINRVTLNNICKS